MGSEELQDVDDLEEVDSKTLVARLFELLERLRKLRRGGRGRPVLDRIDAAAGHARGHLRRQLQRKVGMAADQLFEAMELLGIEAEEAISAARRGRLPVEVWLGELARAERHQLRRLKPKGKAEAPEDVGAALDRLDELLRLGKPEANEIGPYLAALEALGEAGGEQARDLRLRTWELLGAVFRGSAYYSVSAHCYEQALGLAARRPLERARLLRRACYLASDQCDFEQALYFADVAQETYRRYARFAELGQTRVDASIVLNRIGRELEAKRGFEEALKLLDDDPYYLFSTFQCLGLCSVHLDDLAEAERSLQKAKEVHATMKHGSRQLGGLRWLAAEISLAEGDLAAARLLFEEVCEMAADVSNVFQVALANLRLAKVLLLMGDMLALQGLTTQITLLLHPLRRHPRARATLTEFFRLSTDRKLTPERLDQLFSEFSRRGRATR